MPVSSTSSLTAGAIAPQSELDSTNTNSPDINPEEEFDTFLTLLTAQIRNQDPLTPLDSTQFIEQLATFSNLELQAKNHAILKNIEQLLAAQNAEEAQNALNEADT